MTEPEAARPDGHSPGDQEDAMTRDRRLAKGVLAARAGVDVRTAFTLMRSHSRRRGAPLTSVAEAVVAGALGPAELQPVDGVG
jgi:hypothetical protein